MKKSTLSALVLFAGILVYITCMAMQSRKVSHATEVSRFVYPFINSFTSESGVSALLVASDTTYVECEHRDTMLFSYDNGAIQLQKTGTSSSLSDLNELKRYGSYKIGLHAIHSLNAFFNDYIVYRFRQQKMEVLTSVSTLQWRDCSIDTLLINCSTREELSINANSRIKYLLIKATDNYAYTTLHISSSAEIETLAIENFKEGYFTLNTDIQKIKNLKKLQINGKKLIGE